MTEPLLRIWSSFSGRASHARVRGSGSGSTEVRPCTVSPSSRLPRPVGRSAYGSVSARPPPARPSVFEMLKAMPSVLKTGSSLPKP